MLTDAECKSAPHRSAPYYLTDAHGLEFLVTAKSKLWRIRYRDPSNPRKQHRKTIGSYPSMRLSAARKIAAQWRDQLWQGKDPTAEQKRAQELSGELLDVLCTRYVDDHRSIWAERTLTTYSSAINTFRTWARSAKITRANQLTGEALGQFRTYVAALPRRKKAKGGTRKDVVFTNQPRSKSAVNCELRAVHTMIEALRVAGKLPALESNEVVRRQLKRLSEEKRKPTPLKPTQIRKLINACRLHDAKHDAIEPLVLLILLGGFRVGEALALRWEDIDLEDESIAVLSTKTGIERSVDLRVSPALIRMLTSMRHRSESPNVIQHSEQSAMKARKRVIEEFGAPEFIYSIRNSRAGERSAPTLRSTCGSYLTCAPKIFGGASLYRSAAQLGHSVTVAQDHYVGTLRVGTLHGIPAEAKTLEAAMRIEDLLEEPKPRHLRLAHG